MRVLITGASGMLGAALAGLYQEDLEVYATGTRDFPGNPAKHFRTFDLRTGSYAELMDWSRPDVVIHSAALTNVDYCEKHPDEAYVVNSDSVLRILRARPSARVLFISSDAVFSGGRHMAAETDAPEPANVYGRSKVLAERHLAEAAGGHCSIRTTIVGRNANPAKQGFAEWIVNSAKAGKEISLFGDVLFTPISIWDFARELRWVMSHDVSGPLHLAGGEAATKHAFGMLLCARLGLDAAAIRKGSVDAMATSAKRTKDQTLDSSHYATLSGRRLPSLEETVAGLAHHFKDHAYERV